MQQAKRLSTVRRPVQPTLPVRETRPEVQKARFLRKLKLITVAMTCFALSLVVVAQYSSLVVMNYSLSEARGELSSVRESTREYELKAAQLGAVNRIDQIAREELGMVEPEVGQLIIISASETERYRPGE